jgi:hypothetical protein
MNKHATRRLTTVKKHKQTSTYTNRVLFEREEQIFLPKSTHRTEQREP